MQARNRLWQHWREEHPDDENMAALFELPLMLRQPEQMPYIAPHLIEQIARRTGSVLKNRRRWLPRWM